MMDMWLEAHRFLLEMNVGDSYLSGGNKITLIERTKSKIRLSNGVIIWIRKRDGFVYLDGKVTGKRCGGVHVQTLRDVEGYLIYKNLTKNRP
jgi:hypothetical protein